ncbi:MAG: Mth938-like domain-containing protein [Thiohalomonadaceae bacterium]
MKFSLEKPGNGYIIHAYTHTSVTLAGPGITAGEDITNISSATLYHSFALSPQQLIRNWPPRCFDELESAQFTALLSLEPELILLGTGATFHYPAPALLAPIMARGIGVEAMDSGAACRTYNILAAEGRQVVAAILLPG